MIRLLDDFKKVDSLNDINPFNSTFFYSIFISSFLEIDSEN